LITGSSNKIRQQLLGTNLLIENIYGKNGDGLGIMYASDDGLVVTKGLPSAASGFREMVESLPDDDREVALHARWRTHGDIDLDNCHPYQVSDST
jgi:predicted glutamine amidotransferase